MCIDKNDLEHFEFNEQYFQYLIDNNKEFDEEDLREFMDICFEESIHGTDLDRWTRHITTICKLNDKYYAVEWEQGLTEYQEDYIEEQPYEVESYEEVVVIKKWRKKENA